MALWQKILAAAVRARYVPTAVAPDSGPPIGRTARGCLMRFLLLAVFMFIAVAGAAFLFGRALLQGL